MPFHSGFTVIPSYGLTVTPVAGCWAIQTSSSKEFGVKYMPFLNGSFRGQKHGPKAQKWSDIGRNIMHSNNLLRSDPNLFLCLVFKLQILALCVGVEHPFVSICDSPY